MDMPGGRPNLSFTQIHPSPLLSIPSYQAAQTADEVRSYNCKTGHLDETKSFSGI